MPHPINDLRIERFYPLDPPSQVVDEVPTSCAVSSTVRRVRESIHRILYGLDDRLVVIIGPCSIHDPKSALEYAERLASERRRHSGELEILMRVYFEKPRTTVGWKGLINDPDLNGDFRINIGIRLARQILRDINALDLPAACEFLDMTTPQYIADLVAWAAIGARTTESQIHREMASGLSCPVGFKNGTNGDVNIAVDAVRAAAHPHHFMAVDKEGRAAIAVTRGNNDAHIILRGGRVPNYDASSVSKACTELRKAGLLESLIVDVSHGNSDKRHENQPRVIGDICSQLGGGERRIVGVMIESHLVSGRQDLLPGPLVYGQSITDSCIDWETSVLALEMLSSAVQKRRSAQIEAPKY